MVSLFDVLKASKGLPVGDPIAGIWGRKLAGGKIQETEGTLPLTISANGNNLIDYRIYGASGGVGEQTESGEPNGFKLNAVVRSENLFDKTAQNTNDGFEQGKYLKPNNVSVSAGNFNISEYIEVKPSTTYYVKWASNLSGTSPSICFYNGNKEHLFGMNYSTSVNNALVVSSTSRTKYLRMSYARYQSDAVMLIEGSTPPTEYIPYSRTDIPIYIGSTPLEQDEYVDYGEQKVYKYVDGTLTPTDPPVPFPTLPTLDGTTVYDADLTVKPEKMYVKYKKH